MKDNRTPVGKEKIIEPRFVLIPFEQLQPSPDPDYLIKGLFPREGLVVVWGPPKCGKSFWTTDAMLHIALGWDYRGRKVIQGAVVYCAFEGQSGYGKRAEAFRSKRLAENADPVPFYLVAAQMSLVKDHAELIAAIRLQLGTTKPVAAVLDTLNRSMDGSEGDDKDMGSYVRAAAAIKEAFGCAVIVVHHCGVDASRPRGHTSLTGAVDAQLAVKRDATDNVVVKVEWMKDGPEGETILSRLEQVDVGIDRDNDIMTSCIVLPVESDAAAKPKSPPIKLKPAAKVALRALEEALSEVGERAPASNHIPEDVKVVTEDQWRQYAYLMGISDGGDRAKQKAFKSAHDFLIGAQKVGRWGERVWLPG